MMNKILQTILGAAVVLATACTDGFTSPTDVQVRLSVNIPADVNLPTLGQGSFSLYNISTGVTVAINTGSEPEAGVSVLPGLYDISYTATASLADGVVAEVRAIAACRELGPTSPAVNLEAFAIVPTDDLIIAEMFYTGTLQTSGNQYNGDQYFKLYNNTDHTIYADGLAIVESKFLTTQKFDYTPDIMAQAMSIDAVYLIPGSGREHPVEPGGSLLIADIAIDHRELNPNSFDLSHADFEWYDESTNPKYSDIDNPAVPNLDKWYCYTNTVWLLHNRGFKAYALARIPVDKQTYLENYRYSYEFNQVTAAGSFPMSGTCYKIPNEWICDVVTCSVASSYQWNVTAPSLDMGWTSCGTIDGDKNRYFHAVRRRVAATTPDGRVILCKTNDSGRDFIADATPSEIEKAL
ncbi:MAG: DUF4876 domain-containing protein [Muribaculaceae bacterium]|nr:DUF4876 domain-containing protein [Muribaculaceae bacterium]